MGFEWVVPSPASVFDSNARFQNKIDCDSLSLRIQFRSQNELRNRSFYLSILVYF